MESVAGDTGHIKLEINHLKDELDKSSKSLDSKIDNLADENRKNVSELINIKEENLAQKEKVKFVETLSAKVDTVDADRKRLEKDMIERNEDMISKNFDAIKSLEKVHNERIAYIEKDSKDKFDINSEANNKLSLIVEGLVNGNDRLKAALTILNDEGEKLSKTVDIVQDNFKSNSISMNNFDARIKNLENSQILQDKQIDNLKSDNHQQNESLKSNCDSLETSLSIVQFNLENLEKKYEENSKETQQRFDDSGISMADFEEKLNALAENDQTKDITMNELNKSFEDSINSISNQMEIKLENEQKITAERLKMAKEKIKANSENIELNSNDIKLNLKSIDMLKMADLKANENINNIRGDIIGLENLLKDNNERIENSITIA